jgi:predicted glycosyltransferase
MANVVADYDAGALPAPGTSPPGAVRIVHYCHDTYGLGHIRRTLKIAGELRHRWPEASQLIVTGSPVAQRFRLPPGTDYIKLPSVVKVGHDQYASRSLALDFEAIRDLRGQILIDAVDQLRPDLFIVDHAPAGMGGEAVGALRLLKARAPSTRIVLGLRDIVDDPVQVRRAWSAAHVYELLDDVYDLILVYGQQSMCDVVQEYRLSPRAAAKVRYVGYLGAAGRSRPTSDIRAALGLRTDRLVVVTAGGGGDGYELLHAVADGLNQARGKIPFDCMAISGPLMPDEQREQLRAAFEGREGVRYRDFVEDMPDHLAAADLIVSMGGYNTVCEVLDSRRPALIVPRTEPRREQLIRAEALQERGVLSFLHPSLLTPHRLMAEILRLLGEPISLAPRPPMTGLATLAAELGAVLSTRSPHPGGSAA